MSLQSERYEEDLAAARELLRKPAQPAIDLASLPDPAEASPEELAWLARPRYDSGNQARAHSVSPGMWIAETPIGSAVVLCGGLGPERPGWWITRAIQPPKNLRDYKGCLFSTGGVDPQIETRIERDHYGAQIAQLGVLVPTRRELLEITREAVRRRISELRAA